MARWWCTEEFPSLTASTPTAQPALTKPPNWRFEELLETERGLAVNDAVPTDPPDMVRAIPPTIPCPPSVEVHERPVVVVERQSVVEIVGVDLRIDPRAETG
jgi:hypothetical protein